MQTVTLKLNVVGFVRCGVGFGGDRRRGGDVGEDGESTGENVGFGGGGFGFGGARWRREDGGGVLVGFFEGGFADAARRSVGGEIGGEIDVGGETRFFGGETRFFGRVASIATFRRTRIER